jgi:hypothetical protein
VSADQNNFFAIATPVEVLENWLDPIEIDKDGFVGSSTDGGGS